MTDHEISVLKNGRVVDLKTGFNQRAQLVVSRGLILDVLSPTQRLARTLKTWDLRGGYVLPGFNDSHTHLVSRGIELQRIDLGSCRSPRECLDALAHHRRAEIIFGFNWDESCWRRGRAEELNRECLDRIAHDRPVIMRRVCGHRAVVNTAALKKIKPGWTVVDRKTGHLFEDAALFLNEIFPPTDEMIENGLKLAIEEALAEGVTSVQEITIPRNFRILQRLRNNLSLRVAVYLYVDLLENITRAGFVSGLGDNMLKFQGIKVFVDGSIGARTAALRQSYPGTRQKGKLLVSRRKLSKVIQQAQKHGLQLIIHSLGDRATETVIRAFEDIGFKNNILRHRIEHVELIDQNLIERIRRLGLIVSVQPNFVQRWQMPAGLYENRLGNRYQTMNPFQQFIRAGIRMVFGSDSMPLGPRYGIEGAVNHPMPQNRITNREALFSYTTAPAYATFEEQNKGMVKPGMLADLVVLEKDPIQTRPATANKIKLVMVGGRPFPARRFGYHVPAD